jgi:hypothetical protein
VAIKVRYRKLGREKVNGWAHLGDNLIEIDERLRGKQLLEILIHEAFHLQNPSWEEEEVIRKSKELTTILWKEGIRPIENDTKYI